MWPQLDCCLEINTGKGWSLPDHISILQVLWDRILSTRGPNPLQVAASSQISWSDNPTTTPKSPNQLKQTNLVIHTPLRHPLKKTLTAGGWGGVSALEWSAHQKKVLRRRKREEHWILLGWWSKNAHWRARESMFIYQEKFKSFLVST